MTKMLVVSLSVILLLLSLFPFNSQANAADRHHEVIWYGSSVQDGTDPTHNDAVVWLQDHSVDVEKRSRPLSHLNDGDVVVITAQFSSTFSNKEVKELVKFVNHGGKLILAADTDYFHCHLSSTCAMEISRNFGFAFNGDVSGTIVPAAGQSGHPIWNSPNSLSSFTNWCCDAFVAEVSDNTNVKILGSISTENNVPAIVLNENPQYKGGKVMGIGYNMLIGLYGDFTLFDNIMSFMLDKTIS